MYERPTPYTFKFFEISGIETYDVMQQGLDSIILDGHVSIPSKYSLNSY